MLRNFSSTFWGTSEIYFGCMVEKVRSDLYVHNLRSQVADTCLFEIIPCYCCFYCSCYYCLALVFVPVTVYTQYLFTIGDWMVMLSKCRDSDTVSLVIDISDILK